MIAVALLALPTSREPLPIPETPSMNSLSPVASLAIHPSQEVACDDCCMTKRTSADQGAIHGPSGPYWTLGCAHQGELAATDRMTSVLRARGEALGCLTARIPCEGGNSKQAVVIITR